MPKHTPCNDFRIKPDDWHDKAEGDVVHERYPIRRGHGLALGNHIATTAVQALVSMAALTPPVFATVATEDVGLPESFIGYYTSLVYFGAMLTTLVSGGAISRFGAMRVSQGCLLLCFAGLAAVAAMQPGLLVLMGVIGALVLGLGYGPVTPASSHILARTTRPERRGVVFSIKQTGVPIGGMLAGCLGANTSRYNGMARRGGDCGDGRYRNRRSGAADTSGVGHRP